MRAYACVYELTLFFGATQRKAKKSKPDKSNIKLKHFFQRIYNIQHLLSKYNMSTFIPELIAIISLFMLIFGIIICCVYTDSSDTYSRQLNKLNKFKNYNYDRQRYSPILTEIKTCPSQLSLDKKLK